jgi:hypothetical protein
MFILVCTYNTYKYCGYCACCTAGTYKSPTLTKTINIPFVGPQTVEYEQDAGVCATINASNIDISKVKADKVFAVWVDEDAKDHADKVEVNGALVKVEGNNAIMGVASSEELKAALADAEVAEILLAENATIEGTFAVNRNVTIKSADVDNKATIKGRVEVRSANPIFENVIFDRNETDSNNAMQTSSNALQYKAVVMIYGDQTNTIKFEKCRFLNNKGTHKSAITNVACDLIVNECYFEGYSSAIYSQTNLTVTNSTFNYTGGNNVIVSLNGCGEAGGKFIFKGNTITNKIFALSQFLSTVGFGNGNYYFDVQVDDNEFDYVYLNESRVTNKTFAQGSETF